MDVITGLLLAAVTMVILILLAIMTIRSLLRMYGLDPVGAVKLAILRAYRKRK